MHLYSVPVFQAEAPGPLCQCSTRLKEGACVCLYMYIIVTVYRLDQVNIGIGHQKKMLVGVWLNVYNMVSECISC